MYKSQNQVFKNECSTKLSCAGVRRAILFQHNGLCDVRWFVNPDGTARSMDDMCSLAEKSMYTRSWLQTTANELEERGKDWREAEEHKDNVVLSKAKKAKLDQLYASDAAKSGVAFRKALMESKDLNVVAIHFFHWDGTCRDVQSIYTAVLTIPSSHKAMKIWAATMVAGFTGLGALYLYQKLDEKKKRNNRMAGNPHE